MNWKELILYDASIRELNPQVRLKDFLVKGYAINEKLKRVE